MRPSAAVVRQLCLRLRWRFLKVDDANAALVAELCRAGGHCHPAMDLVSGSPFWPIKNGLIASYPPLDADRSCDVAIVGGGVSGALVAHHLVRAGAEVVLLDRRDVGSGSTAASTSLLQCDTDVPLHRLVKLVGEKTAVGTYELGLATVKKLEAMSASLGVPCGFARKQSFYLARTSRDLPALRREYETRRRFGLEVKLLERRQLAAISSLPHRGAILSGGAAQVDAHRLTHALLASATAKGLCAFDRTAVRRCRFGSRGVELVTDRGPRVRARKVVFATGYEAVVHLRGAPTALHSTYAAISEPLGTMPGWPKKALLWETSDPYFYLRTTEEGRAMIGGADEPFRDPRARDALLPEKTRLLARKFRQFFPKIDFEVAYSWSGTFGVTPDGLPYIGQHRDSPHAYYALGYGGNGITFSAIAAEIIRDLWLGRKNPAADFFRFDRAR